MREKFNIMRSGFIVHIVFRQIVSHRSLSSDTSSLGEGLIIVINANHDRKITIRRLLKVTDSDAAINNFLIKSVVEIY